MGTFLRLRRLCWLALAAVLLGGCSAPYRQLTLSDLRDGEGWYAFPELKYRGDIRNGYPNGKGEMVYKTGVQVIGSFQNGVAHGTVEVRVPGYGTLHGEMKQGQFASGRAELNSGDLHVGDFANWQLNGSGTLLRADGSFDHGTFSNGSLHGKGERFDAGTGASMVGSFRGGRPEGNVAVQQGGKVSMRRYDGGRDVTTQWLKERASEVVKKPQQERLEQARRAEEEVRKQHDEAKKEQDRLIDQRSAKGRARYDEACFCVDTPCLDIIDSKAPTPTEAQKRQAEENERRRKRLCREWKANLDDPNFPARMNALQADIRSKNAVLERERQRRVAAEAELARIEAEARAAQSARMLAEIERQRRSADAEASREHAAAMERARTLCTRQPNSCYCRQRAAAEKRPSVDKSDPNYGRRVSCQ